jgi:hypothetical protein
VFRRENTALAVTAVVFGLLVTVSAGAWVGDPVYGMRTFGALAFLGALYALMFAAFRFVPKAITHRARRDEVPRTERSTVPR